MRAEMVKKQIGMRGITDKGVLEAFQKVPRHEFVPPEYRNKAYADLEIPIGEGQTLDRPYEDALMISAMAIEPGHRVLEVGTGSGYVASLMGQLAKEVYTIEILEPLAKEAEKRVKHLGYSNVFVRAGDGFAGWPDVAPFDSIILTCSPDRVPPLLIDQLREGGRIVLPIGSDKKFQELQLYKKINGELTLVQRLTGANFVPMEGEIRNKSFQN